MRLRSLRLLLLGVAALAALVGCKDISQFATGSDESYCGNIVPGGFVRQGFAPGVRMRVHFDPDKLQLVPGDLATDDGTFVDAPLRPIPQLAHDALSAMRYGEDAMRNLLLGVQPSEGAIAYAFLSLHENQGVEVRILRGAPPTNGEASQGISFGPDLFGVFHLTKQKGACGF